MSRSTLGVCVVGVLLVGCGEGPPVGVAEGESLGEVAEAIAVAPGQGVYVGRSHACAIVEGNRVKCWGKNASGQLGLGDTTNRGTSPSQMGEALPYVNLGAGRTAHALALGGSHTCALLDNGQVKCWGDNMMGQLGLGDTASRGDGPNEMGDSLPVVNLGTGRTAKAITAAEYSTCVLLDSDQVKCWGSNGSGMLGIGDSDDRGDEPNEMGDFLPSVDLGAGRTVQAFGAGYEHVCALLDTDEVKCWGWNNVGQLGQGHSSGRGSDPSHMGDNLPRVEFGAGRTVSALTVGAFHACVLLDNAQLKCWGSGANGRLGLGSTATYGDQVSDMGDNLPPVDLGSGRTAVAVAVGTYQTCAILDTQQLKCWGSASRIGQGSTTEHKGDQPGEMGDFLPAVFLGTGRTVRSVEGGFDATCAVLDSNQIKCWGLNGSGQLGIGDTATRGDGPGEMGDALPIVNLGSRSMKKIVANYGNACAVLADDRIKCWGNNSTGQLGLGNTSHRGDNAGEMGSNLPTVALGTGRSAKQLSVGDGQICAVLDDDQVKCWGNNGHGQLGQGDTVRRGDGAGEMGDDLPAVDLGTGRTARQVGAGSLYTCALLDNDQLKCWGASFIGQLGLGATATRGDEANEMGDNLPFVDLGSGRTVKALSAGHQHACAILDNDQVKCWGYNASGQLGQGDTNTLGDGAGEMGDALAPVNLGTGRTAKAIGTGLAHTCALLDNDQVKCWGHNAYGQLGLGNTAHRGDGPGEMGDSLPTVALGVGRSAKAIAVAGTITCALLDTNQVKCWGSGSSGALGQGNTANRGDNSGEMGDSLPIVALGTGRSANAVTLGIGFACARVETNQVKCWGANSMGQLGQGTTTNRGDNSGEMGDFLAITDLGPEPW